MVYFLQESIGIIYIDGEDVKCGTRFIERNPKHDISHSYVLDLVLELFRWEMKSTKRGGCEIIYCRVH